MIYIHSNITLILYLFLIHQHYHHHHHSYTSSLCILCTIILFKHVITMIFLCNGPIYTMSLLLFLFFRPKFSLVNYYIASNLTLLKSKNTINGLLYSEKKTIFLKCGVQGKKRGYKVNSRRFNN